MKKQLFITALAIFGILTSNAQDSGDFELGVGLGLNLANVSTMDEQNKTSSLELHLTQVFLENIIFLTDGD